MREILESIGGFLVGIAVFLLIIFLAMLFIKGGVWIGIKIMPWLSRIMWIVFALDIFIVLPLGIFKKTRIASGTGLVISSYIFGATLWFWTLLITYFAWGAIAIILGLFIAGIGVVPIALLISIIKGQWATLGLIIFFIVLIFGSRVLGLYFGKSADELAYEE